MIVDTLPLAPDSNAEIKEREVFTPDYQRASSEPWHPHEYIVGYVYSVDMMLHQSENGHPEQAARIRYIWAAIKRAHLLEKMKRIPIRTARRHEVLLVHSEDHWDKVMAIQNMTPQEIADSEQFYELLSLYVCPSTTYAAQLSCGGVIEACLAVARKELWKAFAIVRPPGHHAEPDEHMGFCFFNNVAVATRVVQQLTPVKKVLILDWDVHHGNGTQRAFNDDPSVLYISIHRYEQGRFYPCGPFGSMESCGEGLGLGFSVNIPWPEKGMGDADYIHAFQKVVMPIAIEFAPDLVIISAGFDAAAGDELGECFVSPAGYAHMTHMLSGLASGRLVVALEGGYNLESSASSALAVAKIVVGEAPPELPPLVASESGTETVWLVAREQSKYWRNVDPKTCEPAEDMERMSYSIPELLKAHRQHHLFVKYNMYQVPLLNKSIEERFGTQVLCSEGLLTSKTVVVFAHEIGNLRGELANSATCDLHLEHSYHVDFSHDLISWVHSEGHGLLDVNLFPRPFASTSSHSSTDELARGLLTYLFDNYIQLSDAKQVVLIGHGPGCAHLIEFINQRNVGVMQTVRGVIQIVGLSTMPTYPRKSTELSAWYRKHSLVLVPKQHPVLLKEAKLVQRHGTVVPVDETKPIKLAIASLPFIQEFLDNKLEKTATAHVNTNIAVKQGVLSEEIAVNV